MVTARWVTASNVPVNSGQSAADERVVVRSEPRQVRRRLVSLSQAAVATWPTAADHLAIPEGDDRAAPHVLQRVSCDGAQHAVHDVAVGG